MSAITIEKEKKLLVTTGKKKPFDAKKFFGLIKWGEDGIKYQRKLRDGKQYHPRLESAN